jgi:hypothetical protein
MTDKLASIIYIIFVFAISYIMTYANGDIILTILLSLTVIGMTEILCVVVPIIVHLIMKLYTYVRSVL